MIIIEKLEQEIERELEAIRKLDPSSDEHSARIKCLNELVDRYTELKRLSDEDKNKSEDRKAERMHRYIGYGLTFAGIVIPAGLTWWGTKLMFVFEEHATVASPVGRAYMNRLLSKK